MGSGTNTVDKLWALESGFCVVNVVVCGDGNDRDGDGDGCEDGDVIGAVVVMKMVMEMEMVSNPPYILPSTKQLFLT